MTQLGKYKILEEIGRGGFGIVYKARDTSLDRLVALKVLHPELTVDSKFLERFQKEAKALARINHNNVVTIYEIGELEGKFFIAMEYMHGGSLAEKLKGKHLLQSEAIKIVRDIGAGLQAGHEEGLIHRDVKPDNILFNNHGQAVIADFGLAKAMQVSSTTVASSYGGAVGTPYYRAPELWNSTPPPSPATDVYSLACVFYEMLTGDVLFNGDTPMAVITSHTHGPNFKKASQLPTHIIEVLQKALNKEPSQRYSSMTAFIQALSNSSKITTTIDKTPQIDLLNFDIQSSFQDPLNRKSQEFESKNDSGDLEVKSYSGDKSQSGKTLKKRSSTRRRWLFVSIIIMIGAIYVLWVTIFRDQLTPYKDQVIFYPTETITTDAASQLTTTKTQINSITLTGTPSYSTISDASYDPVAEFIPFFEEDNTGIRSVEVYGNYLYVLITHPNRVYIYNIENINKLDTFSSFKTSDNNFDIEPIDSFMTGMLRVSNILYVYGVDGIYIFDLKNPSAPFLLNRIQIFPRNLIAHQNYLLALGKNYLTIYTINDPSNPDFIFQLDVPDYTLFSAVVFNDYLYASGFIMDEDDEVLKIFDFSDPWNVNEVNSYQLNETYYHLFTYDDKMIGCGGHSQIDLWSLLTPDTPQLLDSKEASARVCQLDNYGNLVTEGKVHAVTNDRLELLKNIDGVYFDTGWGFPYGSSSTNEFVFLAQTYRVVAIKINSE